MEAVTNSNVNCSSGKNSRLKNNGYMSPYLSEDRIQLVSRVTEKNFLHKKNDLTSSFPLTVNIYKANSDELRLSKRCCKKIKKSVLTLPNEPAPKPQACTVSDMNDSEYLKETKYVRKPKLKKRRSIQTRRNCRVIDRQTALYKRDANYCSQLDIDVDGSSTDMINNFSNDSNNLKKSRKNNSLDKANFNAHEVWSALRSVNQFQFKPSPPMSQDSLITAKKMKKNFKISKSRKDARFIETCRTEEFAYISSMVDNSSRNSYSQSSFDRITVIEKQNKLHTIVDEIEKGVGIDKIPYNGTNSGKNQQITRSKKIKANQSYFRTKYPGKNYDRMFEVKKAAVQNNNKYRTADFSGGDEFYQTNEITIVNEAEPATNKELENNYSNCGLNMDLNKQCADIVYNYNSSGKSDSSKGEIKKLKDAISDTNIAENINNKKKSQQLAGITKVVLTQGSNFTKQVESFKRKSHLQTIKPNKSIIPKLTLTDIKRKLANIRFPLVILGKDQLSSTVSVQHYEPPQFAGLDKHIWPFMQMWNVKINEDLLDSKISNYKCNTNNFSQHLNTITYDSIENKEKLKYNTTNLVSKEIYQDKYRSLTNDTQIKKPLAETKPIQKFKDKMIQFMHKKSVPKDEMYTRLYNKQNYERKKGQYLVDAATNTLSSTDMIQQKTDLCKKNSQLQKNISHSKIHPKSKSNWASDFIDNIFKKIRSGVYYNQEVKNERKNQRTNKKEDSVQTDIEQSRNNYTIVNDTAKEEVAIIDEVNSVISIPGFDKCISDVEIETLNNFSQIAVRHCVTNIIIQFDVAVTSVNRSILGIKKSFSCIPVTLIDNRPAIFKYETTIINATLPAELCSIIPKLMKKIINPNIMSKNGLVDNYESRLSTISELIRNERNPNKKLLPVQLNIKSKTKILHEGKFSRIHYVNAPKNPVLERIISEANQFFNTFDMKSLMPKITIDYIYFGPIKAHISLFDIYIRKSPKTSTMVIAEQSSKKLDTCKALQPYQLSSKQIILASENLNFTRIVEIVLRDMKVKIYFNKLYNKILRQAIDTNCNFINTKEPGSIVYRSINTLYNGTTTSYINTNSQKAITNSFDQVPILNVDKRKSRTEFCIRNKRKGFVKLYKKCKSMSSISGSRSTTSLDRIANLDDFFLALGTGKMLSGVFDGNSEIKLLSLIREMKNWLTDITPRQALLVLLLANKKDTTNLIRYRPIILQGIAVNRITQASELDMEIEVIERENLNKLTRYEGITYLPASQENHDSLLKELCWIAKTTASDYQKPFDESSERLLKSLLGKRKQLNPSYLRVMARYVGLGLLKNSKK